MKKLLLILTSVMLLASCGSDDNNEPTNNIIFDDVKGYLTNLESVKYGLIGEWEMRSGSWIVEMKLDKVNIFASVDKGDGTPIETYTLPYFASMEGGKFYITMVRDGGVNSKTEITKLNKTTLIYNMETYIRQ